MCVVFVLATLSVDLLTVLTVGTTLTSLHDHVTVPMRLLTLLVDHIIVLLTSLMGHFIALMWPRVPAGLAAHQRFLPHAPAFDSQSIAHSQWLLSRRLGIKPPKLRCSTFVS